MLSFKKALKLAQTWVDLCSDGTCEITEIESKPYGWVFFWNSKKFDQNDISTFLAGNAPIIVNRVTSEIRTVIGTANPIQDYIDSYEATLDEIQLQMTPECHDGIKKFV